VRAIYPDQVRVLWLPWFDVNRRDVISLAIIADAALCAATLGDGWSWLAQTDNEIARRRGRRIPDDRAPEPPGTEATKLVDKLTELAQVDGRALARCRAETSGDVLARIAAARASGIRIGPSVIVGGRIYPGGTDTKTLLTLVETELAPGILEAVAPSFPAR
jgi:hypothetical protein